MLLQVLANRKKLLRACNIEFIKAAETPSKIGRWIDQKYFHAKNVKFL